MDGEEEATGCELVTKLRHRVVTESVSQQLSDHQLAGEPVKQSHYHSVHLSLICQTLASVLDHVEKGVAVDPNKTLTFLPCLSSPREKKTVWREEAYLVLQ